MRYTRKELREELEVRGYSERTIEIYTHHMVNLIRENFLE